MPKLSVIVPIHNDAQHLAQCLKSISQQSLGDLDAILLDANSDDNSLKICEKYVQNDSRFKLVCQQSSDLGLAKNKGLSIASGSLVMFLDPHDYLNPQFALILSAIAEGDHCDMVITSLLIEKHEQMVPMLAPQNNLFNGVYTPAEWLEISFKYLRELSFSCLGTIYQKALFKDIRFPRGWQGSEDRTTAWRIALQASRIGFTNQFLYSNRKHQQVDPQLSVQALEQQLAVMAMDNLSVHYYQDYYGELLRQAANRSLDRGDTLSYQSDLFKLKLLEDREVSNNG